MRSRYALGSGIVACALVCVAYCWRGGSRVANSSDALTPSQPRRSTPAVALDGRRSEVLTRVRCTFSGGLQPRAVHVRGIDPGNVLASVRAKSFVEARSRDGGGTWEFEAPTTERLWLSVFLSESRVATRYYVIDAASGPACLHLERASVAHFVSTSDATPPRFDYTYRDDSVLLRRRETPAGHDLPGYWQWTGSSAGLISLVPQAGFEGHEKSSELQQYPYRMESDTLVLFEPSAALPCEVQYSMRRTGAFLVGPQFCFVRGRRSGTRFSLGILPRDSDSGTREGRLPPDVYDVMFCELGSARAEPASFVVEERQSNRFAMEFRETDEAIEVALVGIRLLDCPLRVDARIDGEAVVDEEPGTLPLGRPTWHQPRARVANFGRHIRILAHARGQSWISRAVVAPDGQVDADMVRASIVHVTFRATNAPPQRVDHCTIGTAAENVVLKLRPRSSDELESLLEATVVMALGRHLLKVRYVDGSEVEEVLDIREPRCSVLRQL